MSAGPLREISAVLTRPAMAFRSAAPVKGIAVLARRGIGDHVQTAIVVLARREIAARSRVVSEAVSRSKTAARKPLVARRRISNRLAAIPSLAKPPRIWRWLCVLLWSHDSP